MGGEEEGEGTEVKESRGDTHPAASDLQVPKEHESNFKNKLERLCDMGRRTATGISINSLKWKFISGHFMQDHSLLSHLSEIDG